MESLQSSQDIKDGLLVQDKVHPYYPLQSSSLGFSYVISFRLVGLLTPDRFVSFRLLIRDLISATPFFCVPSPSDLTFCTCE